MTVYGYARVSTKDQNLGRQTHALAEAGCERIFEEKKTGTNRNREALKELLETLQPGDSVIVLEISRVSRSTKDLLDIVNEITNAGANFKSIKEAWLDTTSAQGKFLLTVFAGLSELERDLISERTVEGLNNARREGKSLGRRKTSKAKKDLAVKLWLEKESTIPQITEATGVSKSVLYRELKERGLK